MKIRVLVNTNKIRWRSTTSKERHIVRYVKDCVSIQIHHSSECQTSDRNHKFFITSATNVCPYKLKSNSENLLVWMELSLRWKPLFVIEVKLPWNNEFLCTDRPLIQKSDAVHKNKHIWTMIRSTIKHDNHHSEVQLYIVHGVENDRPPIQMSDTCFQSHIHSNVGTFTTHLARDWPNKRI